MEEENMSNFVYLIQEREFIKTKEPIYKIGMTTKSDLSRVKSYPKGSILLFYSICNNCKTMETELIELFKSNFMHRKDIGNEYFEGNYKDMIHFCYQKLFDENSECTGEQINSTTSNITNSGGGFAEACSKTELENVQEKKETCKEYNCTQCKINYASYKSLWNHNKKFHTIKPVNIVNNTKDILPNETSKEEKILTCKYCNKSLSRNDAKKRHEKKCKTREELENKKKEENMQLICKYCDRQFNDRSNRWKHEKICISNEEIKKEKEADRIKEQQRLEIELKREENENLRLKLLISNQDSSKETHLNTY